MRAASIAKQTVERAGEANHRATGKATFPSFGSLGGPNPWIGKGACLGFWSRSDRPTEVLDARNDSSLTFLG
jgi:hypothetical protein